MNYKKLSIWVGGILGLFFLLYVLSAMIMWKSPLFSSIDYEGIKRKAVESRDPSKCSRLATNLGDGNPQEGCYFNSIQEIGDVSMCDRYPVDAKFCRNLIATKKGDASLCDAHTKPNDYNWCIYGLAGGPKGPKACDLLKPGTNYSRDRCLLGISEGNTKFSNSGFDQVNDVCSLISSDLLQDYCIGNTINHSKNVALCGLIKDQANLTKGTIASRICAL